MDVGSCMCCVRGFLWHVLGEGAELEDEALTSCSGPDCAPRWACLGLGTLLLPCILCYPPLKAAAALGRKLYLRYAPPRGSFGFSVFIYWLWLWALSDRTIVQRAS